jgi:hypothetical protein
LPTSPIKAQLTTTMNVQEFISESLRQISAGVASAKGEKGITISPQPEINSILASKQLVTSGDYRSIIMVEFDLSVTVQEKFEGEAGANLTVLGIGGKGAVGSSIDQTRIQRIKFQVPIAFTH